MIEASDITVVMQGDIRPDIGRAIRSVRRVLPGVRLILSTFDNELSQNYSEFVDEVVLSRDPGAMPPSVKANNASPNNTNRQLISSQAGLARVATPYVLKMRTDCVLNDKGFLRLFERYSQIEPKCHRLVVSSFYTRHPHGLACYLFHVSDWFFFGVTDRVRQFFSAPLVSYEDATWFDHRVHLKSSSYAAGRFRARFTPEQHLTVHFARSLGYRTPEFLNDFTPDLSSEYQLFLANEVIVAYPSELGFSIGKYPDIERSLYQRIDCVGYADWKALPALRKNILSLKSSDTRNRRPQSLRATRFIANKIRHTIIKFALDVRGVKSILKKTKPRLPSLACVITGVPRGSNLCLESLKFTTTGYETTFFAVFREEFDSIAIREELSKNLPGIIFVVVPSVATAAAILQFEGKQGPAETVIKMWHEVFHAGESIDFQSFDMVMRTRFDIFFSPMLLPHPITEDSHIFIPERMSWSGANDMMAFGSSVAFKKYSKIYQTLDWLAAEGVKVPEMIVSCALARLKLEEKNMQIYCGLYREVLMCSLNKRQLGVLAWKSPASTTYKIGGKADTSEARAAWVRDIEAMTALEALFPTYQTTTDANFYPVVVDRRDGTPFRFMGLHAHLNRAVSMIKTIEFIICHYPPNWDMSNLKICIDGYLFKLRRKGIDEFGRILVVGDLERPYYGKRPWSKLGFSCLGQIVPAEVNNCSNDRRSLTIAISEPLFK